jgi:hypothetical protein
MRTLFKTNEVVKFLCDLKCDATASDIFNRAAGADFLESQLVERYLLPELYQELVKTTVQYTYTK